MNIYKKSDISEHLQKYFEPAEIGLEETPEQYIAAMVEVFRCVWDVLEDNGTLWLNIGDSYNGSGGQGTKPNIMSKEAAEGRGGKAIKVDGLKEKDLIGIPWMMAFALRADGWYLRQDIIWHKPNPMPESVQDRCTKAHEYIFLMSKSQKYYYDSEAIAMPLAETSNARLAQPNLANQAGSDRVPGKTNGNMKAVGPRFGGNKYGDDDREESRTKSGNEWMGDTGKANRRSVWTVATKPYSGAHFAVFPSDLIEPCILAGAAPGQVVLDPFMGSGTTAQVAQNLGRKYLGCELNLDYKPLQDKRISQMSLVLE